ncbi:CPBP family intramembrane glutamic endopeptidase [Victivallis sp. Marseille-Q1083]|uniref:CPBP family intramembrane glutamic endopeptidase n=1 Tax=Victivallis sp. Marseille-Q1083 TaxID=2717288 RepID=UPI001588E5E4|nr:type II CAAX endopeptidase family protein [Victivallis sp. Marseille-Q1083]
MAEEKMPADPEMREPDRLLSAAGPAAVCAWLFFYLLLPLLVAGYGRAELGWERLPVGWQVGLTLGMPCCTLLTVMAFLRWRAGRPVDWLVLFGLAGRKDDNVLFRALLAVIIWLPWVELITGLWQAVLNQLHWSYESQQQMVALLNEVETRPLLLALLILATVVVAPVTEEIIFRRLLFEWLAPGFGRAPAVVLTSLLFGIVHWALLPAPGLILLAIGFQLGYLWRRSLRLPVIWHMLHNGIALLAYYCWDLA